MPRISLPSPPRRALAEADEQQQRRDVRERPVDYSRRAAPTPRTHREERGTKVFALAASQERRSGRIPMGIRSTISSSRSRRNQEDRKFKACRWAGRRGLHTGLPRTHAVDFESIPATAPSWDRRHVVMDDQTCMSRCALLPQFHADDDRAGNAPSAASARSGCSRSSRESRRGKAPRISTS